MISNCTQWPSPIFFLLPFPTWFPGTLMNKQPGHPKKALLMQSECNYWGHSPQTRCLLWCHQPHFHLLPKCSTRKITQLSLLQIAYNKLCKHLMSTTALSPCSLFFLTFLISLVPFPEFTVCQSLSSSWHSWCSWHLSASGYSPHFFEFPKKFN